MCGGVEASLRFLREDSGMSNNGDNDSNIYNNNNSNNNNNNNDNSNNNNNDNSNDNNGMLAEKSFKNLNKL